MKVQGSIDIAASPEKIWPFLMRPNNIVKWCTTYRKCEYGAQQQRGVGTSYYIEEKAGGPLMKLNFKASEWVENQKLALKMTSGNFVKAYDQHLTIQSIPSGSRFNFAENITMPWGILGSIIGFMGRSSSEKHVKEMLAKLKSLAES